MRQNASILKAQNDLQANYGLVVQTRAIALPKIQASGSFNSIDPNRVEQFPFQNSPFVSPHQNWDTGIQIVQSIYEGGKMFAAVRAARLTKEQSLLQYTTVVADTLLATRLAYYDVLLAKQQITVNEASVNLLSKELDDQRRRFEAGTVPRFNVLRAEVAVANERPALISPATITAFPKTIFPICLATIFPGMFGKTFRFNSRTNFRLNLMRLTCHSRSPSIGGSHGIKSVAQSRAVAKGKHH